MNKKFSKKDLEEITDLQNKFSDLTIKLGQIAIEELELQKRKNILNSLYGKLKNIESELLQRITSTYGIGTLDTESGIFVTES